MKLSLPTDPNERKKILILIAIFSMAFLYVGIRFAVMPYLSSMKEKQARMEELEDLLWQADRDIQQMDRNRKRNADTINTILEIAEVQKHVLQPSLGNYLLVAEAQIKEWAELANVTVENIRQISGPPKIDTAKKGKGPAFWPYSLAIQLTEGLHDLTRFVHIIQKDNPYLTITAIVVNAGPADEPIIRHSVNMTLEWPVWTDPEHPNQLAAELLADEEQK